jgi:ABC-type transport system involved in multi-copper enzyme maturation permease subunit
VTTAALPLPRSPLRLVRAELLKLRKRRGVWIPASFLTVGAIAIMYLVLELFHAANSAKYGPAGGTSNFQHALLLLGQLAGMVAAVLIGTSAATEDLSSGVFRELVATGRSRTQLFLARIPGGLALLLPLAGLAYTLCALLTVLLAGRNPTPSAGQLVEAGLWVELAAGITFCLALGLGSLVGSRAASISVLLAWLLVVQQILRSISAFGIGREALLGPSLDRIAPVTVGDRHDQLAMSVAAAVVVIALWAVVPLAAGWWRTNTRDA